MLVEHSLDFLCHTALSFAFLDEPINDFLFTECIVADIGSFASHYLLDIMFGRKSVLAMRVLSIIFVRQELQFVSCRCIKVLFDDFLCIDITERARLPLWLGLGDQGCCDAFCKFMINLEDEKSISERAVSTKGRSGHNAYE